MNTRQAYFDTLTRVSRIVDEVLKNYLDNDEFGEYKKRVYQPLFDKKIGAQKARATLSYLSYCALNNIDPSSRIIEDVAKLFTVPELEIWSEYMVNWIFDNKGEVVKDPIVRKKAAVAAKSFLEDAVKMALQVGPEYVLPVLETSGNVTDAFTKELDLSLKNDSLFEPTYPEFIEFYTKDYGIPGVGKTYTLGLELLATYAGKKKRGKMLSLFNIFNDYGGWIEVLNDLGDFSLTHLSTDNYLTTDKVASDQFSDIRNDDIKPPVWLMYKRGNNKMKKFMRSCVGKKVLNKVEQAKLVMVLFETKTYETISKQLKKKGRDLKKEVKNLNFNNSASSQLQIAMSMFESNKIYHRLIQSYALAKEILGIDDESSFFGDLE